MTERKKRHKLTDLRPEELAKVSIMVTEITNRFNESGLNRVALRHVFNMVEREVNMKADEVA
jgi:hypothetical protein